MTTMTAADTLGEAPETDAAHTEWAADMARQIADLAERFDEHRETLETELDFGPNLTSGLADVAEHLREAADAMAAHLQDYDAAMQGARETADANGGHLPGAKDSGYYAETN